MHLEHLEELTRKKNHIAIRKYLQDIDKIDKGGVFEQYISLLYKGNGWLTAVTGGTLDKGGDILLYHPNKPTKVAFVLQVKNQKKTLTYDATRIELLKFGEQARKEYNCNNYKLISINGFVKNAWDLNCFNMTLHGWDYIETLINNYKEHPKTLNIELLTHNQLAYEATRDLFKTNQRVCVVHATGTGKTYLIGKSLIDNIKRNCLVLAPSNHILRQQEKLLPWLENVKYMTYAKAAKITSHEWQSMMIDFIILDEFHRIGASIWGEGIQRLLDCFPEAKVFGATATPIRYLDGVRDMSTELFSNIIASELSLQDAIAQEILPSPYYVSALYQIESTIDDYKKQIVNSKAILEDKKFALKSLDNIQINWEKTSGVPDILDKHLDDLNGKYIVFCEDLDHLDEMRDQVSSWLRIAAKKKEHV